LEEFNPFPMSCVQVLFGVDVLQGLMVRVEDELMQQ